ncbi:hypothetical protein B296_00052285, partial [Ensete ventricosum]
IAPWSSDLYRTDGLNPVAVEESDSTDTQTSPLDNVLPLAISVPCAPPSCYRLVAPTAITAAAPPAGYAVYGGYGNYGQPQVTTSASQGTAYGAYPPTYPVEVLGQYGIV